LQRLTQQILTAASFHGADRTLSGRVGEEVLQDLWGDVARKQQRAR
jgi:hypothetical protein